MIVATGSDKPVRNRIGETVTLKSPYHGCTQGRIVENIGRNWAGVPMYAVEFQGYENPWRAGELIKVDFAASEFAGEEGEAHAERMNQAWEFLRHLA